MNRTSLCVIFAIVLLPVLGLGAASAFAAQLSSGAGLRIVVPAHDIARGDVIDASDLSYIRVDGAVLMSGVLTRMEDVTGLQARRQLSAGQAFRSADLRHPIVITKGQAVTMQFDAPGVALTAMGRAMGEGGVGDTVTVQNPATFRMISTIVIAPGTVRATGPISAPSNSLARR